MRDRRRSGMTLIEVMIAVAILGIVSSMVWSGFSQTSRNKRRLEERADRYHVIRMAMERIARELSMAYVSAHVNPSPSLNYVKTGFVATDSGGEDRVDFTSFSHQRLYRDAHESDQNELSYFVTDSPDNPSIKVLARREENRIDDDMRRGGRIQVMVDDIESFDLQYLDPLTMEWTKTWDTTQVAMQPNRLPAQVKVVLVVRDTQRRERKLTFGTRSSLLMRFGLNHAVYRI